MPLRSRKVLGYCFGLIFLLTQPAQRVRGEQMLELFNCTWNQVIQKMPEIAEAGYDSLWLPPPTKGASGGYSVGYDVFDPFDLGNLNQAGTTATKYGTEADLLLMVQVAHRFGIRVYFDNIMNHRGSTVPGYNSADADEFLSGADTAGFSFADGAGRVFHELAGGAGL